VLFLGDKCEMAGDVLSTVFDSYALMVRANEKWEDKRDAVSVQILSNFNYNSLSLSCSAPGSLALSANNSMYKGWQW